MHACKHTLVLAKDWTKLLKDGSKLHQRWSTWKPTAASAPPAASITPYIFFHVDFKSKIPKQNSLFLKTSFLNSQAIFLIGFYCVHLSFLSHFLHCLHIIPMEFSFHRTITLVLVLLPSSSLPWFLVLPLSSSVLQTHLMGFVACLLCCSSPPPVDCIFWIEHSLSPHSSNKRSLLFPPQLYVVDYWDQLCFLD